MSSLPKVCSVASILLALHFHFRNCSGCYMPFKWLSASLSLFLSLPRPLPLSDSMPRCGASVLHGPLSTCEPLQEYEQRLSIAAASSSSRQLSVSPLSVCRSLSLSLCLPLCLCVSLSVCLSLSLCASSPARVYLSVFQRRPANARAGAPLLKPDALRKGPPTASCLGCLECCSVAGSRGARGSTESIGRLVASVALVRPSL